MLEALSERLGAIFDRLSNRGRLSETDVAEVLREVRIALLEADVNLTVAKDFVNAIKERAVGADVLASLTPGQSVIKIVHDELVSLLGGAEARLQFSDAPPTVYMLVGLQRLWARRPIAGKLALRLKEQGRRTLLVAADVYRPAAVDQLKMLGKQIDLPVYDQGAGDPVKIARDGVAEARRLGIPTVIIDTAGRLQIDEKLMDELAAIKAAVKPIEILFVADAMTGQEATAVAKGFNERLDHGRRCSPKWTAMRVAAPLSDSQDHRRTDQIHRHRRKAFGARTVLPRPSRVAHPRDGRRANAHRETQSVYSEEQAKDLAQKLRKNDFTLDDFLDQLRQVRKMGSMNDIMKMIPGLSKAMPNVDIDEGDVKRVEAIICSMTKRERLRLDILNGSRRKRIAAGSGMQVADVNRLVKQFEASRTLMKQMGGGKRGRFRMPAIPR